MHTLDTLRKQATAGELCLIDKVIDIVQREALEKVKDCFEKNVRHCLDPGSLRDMKHVQERLMEALFMTKADLNIK